MNNLTESVKYLIISRVSSYFFKYLLSWYIGVVLISMDIVAKWSRQLLLWWEDKLVIGFWFPTLFWRVNLEIPFGDSTWCDSENLAYYSHWLHDLQSIDSGKRNTAKSCMLYQIKIKIVQLNISKTIELFCTCYHKKW